MIQAHEVGHQLQFRNGFPSRRENTARAQELEADGFAGYYMRKPAGYNATWQQAGPAFQFAYQIGDNGVNNPGHHGTPAQRRSATRLGWYLGENNLTVSNFDYYFFYYYDQYVLPATLKMNMDKPADIDNKVHEFILSKVEELRKINSGEMTQEEFEQLED
ncbi:hypothetical protein N7U66_02820 [Lacinutrix neustonica]|uniref:Uncharacterized protein n=1 Tax=Lacinutrix neustonica TaxID=2980107 RepID=A0A9E8MXC5_9FLAO|nr:hypothetical protein [Lacinutrix neustonica]WAC02635.1 hypothetical protein N7U66_02820 [Lacinutrix neustonica]